MCPVSIDDAETAFDYQPEVSGSSSFVYGVEQFKESAKESIPQASGVVGGLLYKAGKEIDKYFPDGIKLFNGSVDVKIADKLKRGGEILVNAADRNVEAMQREFRRNNPRLEKAQENLMFDIGNQGANWTTMLLSGRYAGYVMGNLVLGGEFQERADKYKQEHGGSLEGFAQEYGDEAGYNLANAFVQGVEERYLGSFAQVKSIKKGMGFVKAIGKNAVQEGFIEEPLQDVTDFYFDKLTGFNENEELKDRLKGNLRGYVVASLFGGAGGFGAAVYQRAEGIDYYKEALKNTVPEKDLEKVATKAYEQDAKTLREIVTVEIENSSSLENKRGEVYENMYKASIDAVNRARKQGGYSDLRTEEEVAAYAKAESDNFANWVLEEANRRNTTIQNVLDASSIYSDETGLHIGMTKNTVPEEVKKRTRKKKEISDTIPKKTEELKKQIEENAPNEEKEQNLNDVVSSYDGAENFDVEAMPTEEKQAVFEAEQQVQYAFAPALENERDSGELFGRGVNLGEGAVTSEQERQELAEQIKQEWKESEGADAESGFNWKKLSENEDKYEKLYGAEELNRLSEEYEEEQYEIRKDRERTAKYNEWKQTQEELSSETNEAIQEDSLPEVEKEDAVSKDKIEDFGEKLEGARKDIWQSYRDKLNKGLPSDMTKIKISEVFPEPNYEKAIASGVDVNALATIKALRDLITAKPKYGVKSWVETLVNLRDMAARIVNNNFGTSIIDEILSTPKMEILKNQIDLYRMLGYPYFTKAKGYIIKTMYYHKDRSGQGYWTSTFYDKEEPVSFRLMYKFRDIRVNGDYQFDNIIDGIEAIKKRIDEESEQGKEKKVKFDIYYHTNNKDEIIVGKKVGSGKYLDLKKFNSVKEAQEYLVNNYDELVKELEELKKNPIDRGEVNRARVGEDYRKGSDVSPETFADTFGFRGVQFGNWVEQQTRIKDLNEAYDALVDLSKVLGVPTRAISLNGTLGLAFGARGRKGAAAHYEPDKVVINLTKMYGAGSLAHEWFHALDNSFMKKDEKGLEYTSERALSDNPLSHNRPEVMLAFFNLRNALRKSQLNERSKKWDSWRSQDYFSTIREMGARTFEQYVKDKLAEKGVENDFLANIISTGDDYDTYLHEDEKAEIYDAYDKLFNTLKTRETEKGVEFYQESLDIAEENARLDDIYPAYEGETININGQEKTVYNSNGDRIAKSKEALENFYRWFGDSKVVDEQGRPLVVYHGTGAEFDIFDVKKQGKNDTGFFGRGFYFTPNKKTAEHYANNKIVMPVYLNIKNPLDLSDLAYKQINEIGIDKLKELGIYTKEAKDFIENPVEIIKNGKPVKETTTLENYIAEGKLGKKLSDNAKKQGFDGVIVKGKEFVTFNPNQIKSTSNRGTYSESENIYYQFAGEKAQTAALDNLRLAQNMEINDYSTDEIWRETGWYKGKDGKWRFEISDDDAVVDLSKTATDAGTTLGNILSHDKLYSAYPELRGLSVIVSSEMKGGQAGARYIKGVYDKDLGITIGKRIEINPDIIHRKDVDLKSIIMHEVQHAIQDIEGFASGGSVSTFFDKENMDVFQKLFQEEDNKKFNQAVLDALYEEVSTDAANKISDADDKVVAAAEKFALAEGDGIEEAQVYDDALEELDNALKEAGKNSDWFAELKTKAREKAGVDIMGRSKRAKNYDPFELYKQLYGEVEARNTQARMDLTEEERKAKSPESTQDVANADAIVIFDDGVAMAYEPETYYQSAWHGGRELEGGKFSLKYAGKQVGLAHGYGVYASANVAPATGYRSMVDENITYKGKNIAEVEKELRKAKENDKANLVLDFAYKQNREELDKEDYSPETWTWFENEFLPNVKSKGKLYEVDVPEDAQLIEEKKPFGEQTDTIKEAIKKLNNEDVNDILDDETTGEDIYGELVNYYSKQVKADDLESKTNEAQKLASQALEKVGIKGIAYYDNTDGRCFVIFNPDDVKVIQKFYQRGKSTRGSIQFKGQEAIIRLTESANASTLAHELAHYYLQNTFLYSKSGLASSEYSTYFKPIADYLGIDSNQETIKEWQQEKFARAYEQYLLKGKAETPELQAAFNNYNKWIKRAYRMLKSKPKYRNEEGKLVEPRLTPEIMEAFGKLTGGFVARPDIEAMAETVTPELENAVVEYENQVTQEQERIQKETVYPTTEIRETAEEGTTGKSGVAFRVLGEELGYDVKHIEDQMDKAREFVRKNLSEAKEIVNGKQAPEGMLSSAINLAYVEVMENSGNYQEAERATRLRSMEQTRRGQEIAMEKATTDNILNAETWSNLVLSRKSAEAARKYFKNDLKALQDFIKRESVNIAKQIVNKPKEERAAIIKENLDRITQETGILFQEDYSDLEDSDYYNEVLNETQLMIEKSMGIGLDEDQIDYIHDNVRQLQDIVKETVSNNGNISIEAFKQIRKMYDTIESYTPSSNVAVWSSIIGRGAMLASIKSPILNIISNAENMITETLSRKALNIATGQSNDNIVDSNIINDYLKWSYNVYQASGYMPSVTSDILGGRPILGEKRLTSQGQGKVRAIGRFAEDIVFKELMGLPDSISKDLNFVSVAGNKATQQAYKEGLSGDKAKARANELFKDAILLRPMTEEGERIRNESMAAAHEATFTQDSEISKIALRIRDVLNSKEFKAGDFLVPFVKTPANVVALGMEYSLGSIYTVYHIKDIINNPQSDISQAAIKAGVRNGIGMILAMMLAGLVDDDDYIPEYDNASPKQRDIAKLKNAPFNSIRIGNKWINLDYFGPLAIPMAGILTARAKQDLTGFLQGVSGQALKTPGVKEINSLIGDVTRAVQYGVSYKKIAEDVFNWGVEQTASRTIPAIFTDFGKLIDKYERETGGEMVRRVMAKIPVLREELPIKTDITGRKVETEPTNILFGSRVKTAVDDAVVKEIDRLNKTGNAPTISDPTRYGYFRSLETEEKDKIRAKFNQEYGRKAREKIASSAYKRLDDAQKKKELNKIRKKISDDLKKQK